MTYRIEHFPRFSEADIDARVGARTFLYYFQDTSARHFCSFGKGNDTVPYDYGISWILSKYRLQVRERALIGRPLELETWIEPSKSPVRLHTGLRVAQDGKTCALGQMELCLADLKDLRLSRLSEIDFPTDVQEDAGIEVPHVRKIRIDEDALQPAYTYTVRYGDLDNNRHMNNLHYVDLLVNAFDSAFYEQHPIAEVEMEFVAQCYEGDAIEVLARHDAAACRAEVAARRPDGTTALRAVLGFAR